jgi:hypothetical protein
MLHAGNWDINPPMPPPLLMLVLVLELDVSGSMASSALVVKAG